VIDVAAVEYNHKVIVRNIASDLKRAVQVSHSLPHRWLCVMEIENAMCSGMIHKCQIMIKRHLSPAVAKSIYYVRHFGYLHILALDIKQRGFTMFDSYYIRLVRRINRMKTNLSSASRYFCSCLYQDETLQSVSRDVNLQWVIRQIRAHVGSPEICSLSHHDTVLFLLFLIAA
jgi:hypothetical protein